MTERPPIGVPRLYAGSEVPVLYPGEMMTARVNPEAVIEALQRGDLSVPVTDWLVEPTPGGMAGGCGCAGGSGAAGGKD